MQQEVQDLNTAFNTQRKAERQARWLKQLDGEQVPAARTGYRDVQEGDEL